MSSFDDLRNLLQRDIISGVSFLGMAKHNEMLEKQINI